MDTYTFIKKAGKKGRGVFACKNFLQNDIIECCHVILVESLLDEPNPFKSYVFRVSKTKIALLLGNGSLYNHSFKPNARVQFNSRKKIAQIIAYKSIKAGEEICFNYNGNPNGKDSVGFDVV